jgi:hypothetical protein
MGNEADSNGTAKESRSSSGWALRRAGALVAAAAVLVVLWVAVKPRSDDSGSESATGTAEPRSVDSKRTMYGCLIVPYQEAETPGDLFAGVTLVEPYCTDAALLEERCGVPHESLVVPPSEDAMDGTLTRYYTTEDGSPAGSFLTYTGVGGPPGVVSTLICVDGSAINFTTAEWDQLNEPAVKGDGSDVSTSTSTTSPALPDRGQVLAPASAPSRTPLCREPLNETANGNADPTFCADGSLNVDAWTYLAGNNPTLFRLGPDATFDEVTDAICADVQVTINSTTDSTYRMAAAYYGWHFDADPTVILYGDPGCPR